MPLDWGVFFTLGSWTFEETSSSSLKTGNQKQFPRATHFPLPVLCKEQQYASILYASMNIYWQCLQGFRLVFNLTCTTALYYVIRSSIYVLARLKPFWFPFTSVRAKYLRTSQDLFWVKKFIGINMQKEIHFKTAWLFFKPFYNMKTHV